MQELGYGRTLMGDSLGFHIIFALLGVGIPFLVSLAELIGIKWGDTDFTVMAKRWCFPMAVLFVIGAASGTIISVQLSALWPVFMALAGKVIGLPFYLEAFCFFIEAIFLGIYLYSWDRFANKYVHWLCSLPIVLGALGSSFFITTANAFMSSPAGFTYKDGVVSNIDPWKAMFNAAVPTETSHSIISYYLTTCLCFAAVYAYCLWKPSLPQRVKQYYMKALVFTVSLGFIFVCLVSLTGHSSAKYLANYEPLKLAATESLAHSQTQAPLQFFGITIPGMLSWLSFGRMDAYVQGLDAFDPRFWPPLWIHYMFDSMVAMGILLTVIPAVFLLLYWRARRLAVAKPMLFSLIAAGILSFVAVEVGWILTEVGRQPYAIQGILLTNDAFTTNQSVLAFAWLFPMLYVVLFVVTGWILKLHLRKHPVKNEL